MHIGLTSLIFMTKENIPIFNVFSLMKLWAKLCAILHTTRYTFPALAACHDIKIYKFANGNTQFKFKNQHIFYYTDMKMISISKITTYYK